MASYPTTDETARKILAADYESPCPHDGAYLDLSGYAQCPTCGQRTWRWHHVPSIVTGPDGVEHGYTLWQAQDTAQERIVCWCRRVFNADTLNGHKTPGEAFFHHMEAQHAARLKQEREQG
jgi:hypothetical protein